jgi:hypothetical protein
VVEIIPHPTLDVQNGNILQDKREKQEKLAAKFHEKTHQKEFHEKSSNPKTQFGEKFKNAFKNTNPKNTNPKKGNEIKQQLETKNDISKSIKKSLTKPGVPEKQSDPEITCLTVPQPVINQPIPQKETKVQNLNENSNNDNTSKNLFIISTFRNLFYV